MAGLMRIVHLSNHAHIVGNGIVNMMIDLACAQARAGHEVTVASSGGSFEALLARERVRHVHLAQSPRIGRLPTMLKGFKRLIADCKPDIVHAHMMTGVLIARFGALRRRYALVTTVHNEFQKSAILMGFGDAVVGVTESVAVSMAKRGVPKERLHFVRNGTIGTPRFAQIASPESPPELDRPSIVTVAGMYARKGIGDLLRAFALLSAQFPGAALYLIGDGPERTSFEALARELGIAERAHFKGFVADPRAYLARADVFVLASHKEPAGLVLSEAREAGCAIVATRVDGITEMLDHGDAGLLVPPQNPSALAAAIGRLLTDQQLRTSLVARARHNLETFHVERVCAGYLSIYQQLVDALHARRQLGVDARGTNSVRISANE
jgi:glycosyltransferase involved in cell wall biosynthesis